MDKKQIIANLMLTELSNKVMKVANPIVVHDLHNWAEYYVTGDGSKFDDVDHESADELHNVLVFAPQKVLTAWGLTHADLGHGRHGNTIFLEDDFKDRCKRALDVYRLCVKDQKKPNA